MIASENPLPSDACASRDAIDAFAGRSPRLADLARTHPLLFTALATAHGDHERRRAAIDAALAGHRLRTVCAHAGVPYCLRTVPPEHCPVPLPPAHWSADASPTLAQYIPEDPITLRNWVPSIFFAHAAAGEMFALWLAVRHEMFSGTLLDHRHLLPIALFIWFRRHPEHELHRLLPGGWTPRASLRRLVLATRAWLNRICCRSYLPYPEASPIIEPFRIGQFFAYELTDWCALLTEQRLMTNCLDRYARRIASGSFAVFSLRTALGARVANFEVELNTIVGPAAIEIKGRGNAEMPHDIVKAIDLWVAASAHIFRRRVQPMQRAIDAEDIFGQLISPYIAGHHNALAHYGPLTLRGLEEDLARLADRLDITTWPVCFE